MEETTEEILEDPAEELYFKTGFNFQSELEILKTMLSIAQDFHKGLFPGLAVTREAVKKSVNELCAFFCEFVDCL